jgi:hypothetical protein
MAIYSIICYFSPVPGAGVYEPYDFTSETTIAEVEGISEEKDRTSIEKSAD